MSVIKSFVANSYKLCEIYRTMGNIYGEACFNPKSVHRWDKHDSDTTSLYGKDSPWSGNSGKEKVSGVAVNKEGYPETLLWLARGPSLFPWKKCNCK